jgi:hypothetical protein
VFNVAHHAAQGCQYLLIALFKLFQFNGRHIEGLQVGLISGSA